MKTEGSDGRLERDIDGESGKLVLFKKTASATLRFIFFDADTSVPRHRHKGPTITYTIGGPCFENAGDGPMQTKRLSYHPPGHEHSLHFHKPTNLFLIEVSDEMGMLLPWPDRSIVLPATLYGNLWQIFLCVPEDDDLHMDFSFKEFFVKFIQYSQISIPMRLENIMHYIHSDWRKVPSARDIAQHFSMSAQHLSYSFKRYYGVTTQQYGVLLRLDHAMNILWGTDIPLAKVAAETGFADQSHLTRALKAHLENTPLQFRKSRPSRTYEAIRLLPRQAGLAFIDDVIDQEPESR